MSTDQNTPEGEAVEALPRWNREFELAGFLGHDGNPVAKIAIVINPKGDDLDAVAAAHEETGRRAKTLPAGGATFAQDDIVLTGLKNVEALWRCIRRPGDLERHAFITPSWMLKHLDEDQLTALARLYAECRKRRGPLPWDISNDWIEAVRDACAAASGDAVPEHPLAGFSREYMSDFLAQAMTLWASQERAYLARIEALESELRAAKPAEA
jgi:hypothetical protein